MKLRNFLTTLTLGVGTVACVTCGPKAVQNVRFDNDSKLNEIMVDTYSKKMTDAEKVIEYNKLRAEYGYPTENYILVDKKKCRALVMSPQGDTLLISEVALGKNKGDKRGGGYGVKGAKLRAYTTPGEYTISREGTRAGSKDEKLYGKRCLALRGDHTMEQYKGRQVLALHRVPSSPMGKLRENVFRNGTISDNRVSYGCVNYMVDDYDKMRKLINGVNTEVYILPEEKGNSLALEKQGNGDYKFVQTKYRTESMENNK